MAHKWARWLHDPCRLGGPHGFKTVGQNERWPTSGQGGYIIPAAPGVPTASERGAESRVAHKWARWLHNPAAWGVPTASERGAQSMVAHKWARWLHNPCRLRGPHRFSGGQNQRWPTSGQGGYITPAAWHVPTASEWGGRITGGPQVHKVAT